LSEYETRSSSGPGPDEAGITGEIEASLVELIQVSMGGRTFLIPTADVMEVIRPVGLTKVPMAPEHILGLANVHGQIVCVIEPGKLIDLSQAPGPADDHTRFVVLRHPRMHVAVRADRVTAIHRLPEEALPKGGPDANGVRGEVEVNGDSFELLDTEVFLQQG
jgi:chemotaxis signal transduction protein